MTIYEQIRREQNTIRRLQNELAAREAELMEAAKNRDSAIESVCALAHARLGVSAARRLLAAHESSLAIIKGRAALESKREKGE